MLKDFKRSRAGKPSIPLLAGLLCAFLFLSPTAHAQKMTTGAGCRCETGTSEAVPAGTEIKVRTIQPINTMNSGERVFQGVVQADVFDGDGNLAIPQNSDAELIIRCVSNLKSQLDLDSVKINGTRYGLDTFSASIVPGHYDAMCQKGCGTEEIVTVGERIVVPMGTLLTFRLVEPLQAAVFNNPFMRGHYGGVNNLAYRRGVLDGRCARMRNSPENIDSSAFASAWERCNYALGYERGYQEALCSNPGRENPFCSGCR